MKEIRKIVREILKEVMLIKETDSLLIKNFPYDDELDTIGNISYFVVKSISNDLLDKLDLTPKERERVRGFMDDFVADGTGHFDRTGVMNFYTRKWPERTHDKIVGYIKWILSEKDIKVGEITKNTYADAGWTREEMDQRGLKGFSPEDVRVIRIPIVENPHTDDDKPWDINLSQGTWRQLFDILDMNVQIGDDISAPMLINKVDEALAKIDSMDNIPDERMVKKLGGGEGGGGIYTVEKNKDTFKTYLGAMKDAAQWALDRGYQTMYIA